MIRNKSQELQVSDPKLLCITSSQGFTSCQHKGVTLVISEGFQQTLRGTYNTMNLILTRGQVNGNYT